MVLCCSAIGVVAVLELPAIVQNQYNRMCLSRIEPGMSREEAIWSHHPMGRLSQIYCSP